MFRYIGNKSKVLPALIPIITEGLSPGSTVADLMCGTASVSAALRASGYRVVAADQLTFPVHHAVVRVLLSKEPNFNSLGTYDEVLALLNNLQPEPGYFVREYSDAGHPESGDPPRRYLSPANAAKLDAISEKIGKWYTERRIDFEQNALLRHDLVLAVNKVANIAGTYGHFRAEYGASSLKPIKLAPSAFTSFNPIGHRAIQGRVEDVVADVQADILYLDPPYKKRQYAANYHLLETVARGDQAPASGKSGLRDWWPQYSDFCSKRKIGDAFSRVFAGSTAPRILVSYSEDGLLSEERMRDMLSEFGTVATHRFLHSRFRSNASKLGPSVEEFVFEVDRR